MKFDAALEWVAAHPWITTITSADLRPTRDCVGTIDMHTAICPSVDPGGVTSLDVYGKEIHFDSWYDNWKNFRSVWLNQTLEEISQSTEFSIIDWPLTYRNRLYELGQMTFSMYLHESQWNKQPLESLGGMDANQRGDVIEPEDFVIAATLQLRNAQVYLNAAVWAWWALGSADDGVHLNEAPVIELLRNICYQDIVWRDERYRNQSILEDPLRWRPYTLQNVILYNHDLLLATGPNGGVLRTFSPFMTASHTVSVAPSRPTSSFQVNESLGKITCDGEVLQNTVFTPNHADMASDVLQSRGIIGKKYNPKTGVNAELDCTIQTISMSMPILGSMVRQLSGSITKQSRCPHLI